MSQVCVSAVAGRPFSVVGWSLLYAYPLGFFVGSMLGSLLGSCGVDVGLLFGQFLISFWSILVFWRALRFFVAPGGPAGPLGGSLDFPGAEKYTFLRCF